MENEKLTQEDWGSAAIDYYNLVNTIKSNLNLSAVAASEVELQNTEIQLNIASSMMDIIDNSESFEIS